MLGTIFNLTHKAYNVVLLDESIDIKFMKDFMISTKGINYEFITYDNKIKKSSTKLPYTFIPYRMECVPRYLSNCIVYTNELNEHIVLTSISPITTNFIITTDREYEFTIDVEEDTVTMNDRIYRVIKLLHTPIDINRSLDYTQIYTYKQMLDTIDTITNNCKFDEDSKYTLDTHRIMFGTIIDTSYKSNTIYKMIGTNIIKRLLMNIGISNDGILNTNMTLLINHVLPSILMNELPILQYFRVDNRSMLSDAILILLGYINDKMICTYLNKVIINHGYNLIPIELTEESITMFLERLQGNTKVVTNKYFKSSKFSLYTSTINNIDRILKFFLKYKNVETDIELPSSLVIDNSSSFIRNYKIYQSFIVPVVQIIKQIVGCIIDVYNHIDTMTTMYYIYSNNRTLYNELVFKDYKILNCNPNLSIDRVPDTNNRLKVNIHRNNEQLFSFTTNTNSLMKQLNNINNIKGSYKSIITVPWYNFIYSIVRDLTIDDYYNNIESISSTNIVVELDDSYYVPFKNIDNDQLSKGISILRFLNTIIDIDSNYTVVLYHMKKLDVLRTILKYYPKLHFIILNDKDIEPLNFDVPNIEVMYDDDVDNIINKLDSKILYISGTTDLSIQLDVFNKLKPSYSLLTFNLHKPIPSISFDILQSKIEVKDDIYNIRDNCINNKFRYVEGKLWLIPWSTTTSSYLYVEGNTYQFTDYDYYTYMNRIKTINILRHFITPKYNETMYTNIDYGYMLKVGEEYDLSDYYNELSTYYNSIEIDEVEYQKMINNLSTN